MSVFENVLVAATQGAGEAGQSTNAWCLEVLDRTGLIGRANVAAGGLTLLERKRLELAWALGARPSLLLLDETAGGLSDQESQSLIQTINDVRTSGVSIIWIEHVVHALLAVVDRLIVIDFGKVIAEGEPQSIMASRSAICAPTRSQNAASPWCRKAASSFHRFPSRRT